MTAVRAAKPGLREAHREVTRQRILEAAVAKFSECGYVKPTLDDIAELAQVNRGTIYLHFKNKAQILAALVASVDDVMGPIGKTAVAATSREELVKANIRALTVWEGEEGRIMKWLQDGAASDAELATLLENYRERHLETTIAMLGAHGISRQLARARGAVMVSALFGTFIGLQEKSPVAPDRIALAEALADLFAAFVAQPTEEERSAVVQMSAV